MAVTDAPASFSELYIELENRIRVTTGITSTENQAKRAINVALQDLHLGFDYRFPWAERNAILVTHPQYTTGTLTATQGSMTITGSSTLWNTAGTFGVNNMIVGGKIRIDGASETYEISAIASDTSATLTSRFTPSTATAVTYTYFEDEYDLESDFLRPVDQQQFADDISIELVGRTEFRRRYPRNHITGKPTVATLIDRPPSGNVTPVRKVRLHKPPDIAYSIPYAYITSNLAVSSSGAAQVELSADADEPIIPLRYRYALILHALAAWYRDKKDDDRSQEAKAEYVSMLTRTANDVEIGASRLQLRPRVAHYIRKAKSPYSRRGGRFDRGSFDNMGN
jgi:hypothetical protein